jgi:Zn-dependent protease
VGWSFSLGRIAGIRVVVNWTLLLLVPFAAWLLAASALPAQDPGLSRATYLAMALVATTLLIVSILLHEIGHAIAARRQGMGIEDVTLWFLGPRAPEAPATRTSHPSSTRRTARPW